VPICGTYGAQGTRTLTLVAGANRAGIEPDVRSISGQLVDKSGKPLAGMLVRADCADCDEDDWENDTTDPDGKFDLRSLTGYKLHASTSDKGRLRATSVDGHDRYSSGTATIMSPACDSR
jgi:hypothetical protein